MVEELLSPVLEDVGGVALVPLFGLELRRLLAAVVVVVAQRHRHRGHHAWQGRAGRVRSYTLGWGGGAGGGEREGLEMEQGE